MKSVTGFSILVISLLTLSCSCLNAAADDPGWPRLYQQDDAKLIVYQPQIESWDNQTSLTARTAVQVTTAKGNPAYGAISFSADTVSDADSHQVALMNVRITGKAFPAGAPADSSTSNPADIATALFPRGPEVISLDRLLASIKRTKALDKSVVVSYDPPVIFVSQKKAFLVDLDGDPVLKDIPGTNLAGVVNSNMELFFCKPESKYYLLAGSQWLTTDALMGGSWQVAQQPPADLAKIPPDNPFAAVLKEMTTATQAAASEPAPQVFVSKKPAELINIDGPPKLADIPATDLFYVSNTASDLFFDSSENNYYFLISGRWFRSASLDGPWVSARGSLPPDFAKIPPDCPRATVLPSVPGTEEAKQSVIMAQVPRVATIKRDQAKVNVTYQGQPQFQKIGDTQMSYAANTSYNVINADGKYYCCYNGVWFVSDSPTGPWSVCDDVPGSIYTIPPTSPVYPVTYVNVYDSSPDTVDVGYTLGYLGGLVADGSLVYGTGYYYQPYIDSGVYYGWPVSYGGAAYYDWPTGGWNYGYHYSYHYDYFRNYWGRPYWGWHDWHSYWGHYNHDWNVPGRLYSQRWGSNAIVPRAPISPFTPRNLTTAMSGISARGGITNNNVFAGKDGQIYRRDAGGWNRYDNGKWSQYAAAGTGERNLRQQGLTQGAGAALAGRNENMAQLERDANSRQIGEQHANTYQQWRDNTRPYTGSALAGAGSMQGRYGASTGWAGGGTTPRYGNYGSSPSVSPFEPQRYSSAGWSTSRMSAPHYAPQGSYGYERSMPRSVPSYAGRAPSMGGYRGSSFGGGGGGAHFGGGGGGAHSGGGRR
ncbi:MAG: hypothetical protein WCK47_01175 [bacterium]|nr:hypothetical protein [Candidatus Sumerlaeota bacterium]